MSFAANALKIVMSLMIIFSPALSLSLARLKPKPFLFSSLNSLVLIMTGSLKCRQEKSVKDGSQG